MPCVGSFFQLLQARAMLAHTNDVHARILGNERQLRACKGRLTHLGAHGPSDSSGSSPTRASLVAYARTINILARDSLVAKQPGGEGQPPYQSTFACG